MSRRTLSVLSVASELYPLVKTGGLADVAGALPAALSPHGIQMVTLVPGYRAVLAALDKPRTVARLDDLIGGPATLIGGRAGGLDLLALDVPHFFARSGNPYVGPDGADWPDNALRFAALAQAAALIGRGAVPRYRPQVIHAHDWQAGLVPAYLRWGQGGGEAAPATVLTVHNLAFQGRFDAGLLADLALPPAAMSIDGVEYFGGIGFLKAGLALSDAITTVSPRYAAEIAIDAGGMGLGGLIAARGGAVSGILNGIDTDVWNPASDGHVPAPYSAEQPGPRQRNKVALLEAFGLDWELGAPLYGVVSRLTAQKGLDLLLAALPTLIEAGGRLAVIGTGDPALEAGFQRAAERWPGKVGVLIGYDEHRAHLMQAGADMLLVPSRFEPCGLTQLCALRYGAIPLVARTGGLADTVIDANPMALRAGVATGIQFAPDDLRALEDAIRRGAALHADRETWARMRANAMAADVSWRRSASEYAALYRSLAAGA